MHERRLAEVVDPALVPSRDVGDGGRQLGDALGMPRRRVVLDVDRAGERPDADDRPRAAQVLELLDGRQLGHHFRRIAERHVAAVRLGPEQRSVGEAHELSGAGGVLEVAYPAEAVTRIPSVIAVPCSTRRVRSAAW